MNKVYYYFKWPESQEWEQLDCSVPHPIDGCFTPKSIVESYEGYLFHVNSKVTVKEWALSVDLLLKDDVE